MFSEAVAGLKAAVVKGPSEIWITPTEAVHYADKLGVKPLMDTLRRRADDGLINKRTPQSKGTSYEVEAGSFFRWLLSEYREKIRPRKPNKN